MATSAIAMHGTHVGTQVQLTFVIHQQLTYKNMSNSVHNCESNTHSALINSCVNCQGNDGLIAHNILSNILMALIIVVRICCSVPQLHKYKQSGNKVRST